MTDREKIVTLAKLWKTYIRSTAAFEYVGNLRYQFNSAGDVVSVAYGRMLYRKVA